MALMSQIICVTDSKEIRQALTSSEKWKKVKDEERIYEREPMAKQYSDTYLIELREEEVVDGSFTRSCGEFLERFRDKENLFIVNSFSPTERGNALFTLFMKYSGLRGVVKNQRKRYIQEKDSIPMNANEDEAENKAEALKLWIWAKRTINYEIGTILSKKYDSIDVDYDMSLMPLYKEIEQKRKNTVSFEGGMKRCVATLNFEEIETEAELCEVDGNGRFINGFEKSDISCHAVETVSQEIKNYTLTQPEPMDILSLITELKDAPIRLGEIVEILMSLYAEGIISYPLSCEKKLNKCLVDKMATLSDLSCLDEGKGKWNPISRTPSSEAKDAAGGIVILKNSNLTEITGNMLENERLIWGKLLQRQVAMLSQPVKIREFNLQLKSGDMIFNTIIKAEISDDGRKTLHNGKVFKFDELIKKEAYISDFREEELNKPTLCTAANLITYLRIHAVANEYILEILRALDKSRYINFYAGVYLVRESDRDFINSLPAYLTDMTLLTYVLAEVQKVQKAKSNAHEFMEKIHLRLSEIIEKMERDL